MQTFPLKNRRIKPKENLEKVILDALRKNKQRLKEGDVLVISSKVVSICEARIKKLEDVKPSKKAKSYKFTRYGRGKEDPRIVELALRESTNVIPGNMVLTLTRGILMPTAGIDGSNIPTGFVVLWPKNPWKTARKLWNMLRKKFNIKKLGIIIADSKCEPLRLGTVGLALSYTGFLGVEDLRGKKDLFGSRMDVTRKNNADNLTSSALVVIGETTEQNPFAIVRGAPVPFSSKLFGPKNISLKPKDCLFSGLYPKNWL